MVLSSITDSLLEKMDTTGGRAPARWCDGLGNALISNKFSLLVWSKFLGQFGLYFQSISSDTKLASVINSFGKPHVRS